MGFPCPWDFPGKNTGVGGHFLLQEIFLTQGLNPGLPHCRQTLYGLSHQGQRHLVGYRPWGHKESDTTERLHFTHQLKWGFLDGSVVKNRPANTGDEGSTLGLGQSLEKEMATHSSILIWEIPRTEEPGGLHSRGSQRVKKHLSK